MLVLFSGFRPDWLKDSVIGLHKRTVLTAYLAKTCRPKQTKEFKKKIDVRKMKRPKKF